MTVTTGARGDEIGRVDVFRLDLQHLFFERLHLHVGAELARDHRRGLVVERAVDGHHHPAVHQLLQDVLRLDVELVARSLTVMPSASVMVRVTGGGGALHRRRRLHARSLIAARARTLAARPDGASAAGTPGMPGRGGAAGRTGCDGSGRGPPIGAPAAAECRRPVAAPAGAPRCPATPASARPDGSGCRSAPARLRTAAAPGGRTSMARRGGAGGASPVRGSSTRSRSVGGTMRPVGAGITGRGGAGGRGRAQQLAACVDGQAGCFRRPALGHVRRDRRFFRRRGHQPAGSGVGFNRFFGNRLRLGLEDSGAERAPGTRTASASAGGATARARPAALRS